MALKYILEKMIFSNWCL